MHTDTVASGFAICEKLIGELTAEKALLGCDSLIVCSHSYPTFTSHPKSILDQFHARERNNFSKIQNIFSLIICAFPVVIKLLGGITEKIIALLSPAALHQLFLSFTNLDYDAGSIAFKHACEEEKNCIFFLITVYTFSNSGALKCCQETIEWRVGWSDQLCVVPRWVSHLLVHSTSWLS